jgi:tRNA-modifying protein YgfZ
MDCGYARLDDWARLRLSGPDRSKFLNGLVTNDVMTLAEGSGMACLLLTPKGKLQADFLVYNEGKSLLLLCPPSCAKNLRAAIAKMIPLSESTLEDAGGPGPLLLVGDKAADKGTFPVPRWGGSILLSPLPPADAEPLTPEQLETRRVERGVPAFGVDVGPETIPQEAPILEDAISYTKGCYMGQETISRVHHMGHVNKKLVGLKCAQKPADATSVVYSERLSSYLALATVKADLSAPGTATGGGVVVSLPV